MSLFGGRGRAGVFPLEKPSTDSEHRTTIKSSNDSAGISTSKVLVRFSCNIHRIYTKYKYIGLGGRGSCNTPGIYIGGGGG